MPVIHFQCSLGSTLGITRQSRPVVPGGNRETGAELTGLVAVLVLCGLHCGRQLRRRRTLRRIFQHPAGHNIEWRAVLSLLAAVGSAQERHDGKVAVTIGAQTEYFDPPRHKDIGTQAVVNLRRMLTQTGHGADAAKAPAGSAP